MFGDNDFPVGPNGEFRGNRMRTGGNRLIEPQNREGEYLLSRVAQLPTEEKEFSTVANSAKAHMAFGERRRERPRSLQKMGEGFQHKQHGQRLMRGRNINK